MNRIERILVEAGMMQPYRRTDVKVLVLITEPAGTLLQ